MGKDRYDIAIEQLAETELGLLRAFERRRLINAIDSQLAFEPTVPTRDRKRISVLQAGFEFDPPLWELRVGDYRVFYDVDKAAKQVAIRAVRYKGPRDTTEEIVR